ncbi:DUF6311 domain-containing protein [Ancylobacter sp. VNQ12]|uniref:DUF6311 domain-containing protein n=1 Tax=Ancylobacter sp. VNQ12 TaxID=3400920 RepID=UPI003BFE3D28
MSVSRNGLVDGPLSSRRAGRAWHLVGLLASATLGAIIAFSILPYEMLLGYQSYWNNIIGDNATSLAGFYSFANDKWRWPVLFTSYINYPSGANIYYIDAVPVLAIIGKALFKITGYIYPYMGAWILSSYILNGVFGYLIFRLLKMDVFSSFISSSLVILVPEFIFRHPHIGLVAQFFILISIYLYLKFTSASSKVEIYILSISISLVIVVNVYLFAMCFALIVAGILDSCRLGKVKIGAAISIIMLIGIFALVMSIFMGLIGAGQSLPGIGGFGIYSMNLLSPVWPQYSILTGVGFLDTTGGQYEGFNYLGLGILGIFVVSAVFFWKSYLSLIKDRPFIALILVLLIAYAASTIVYLGDIRIAKFRYDEWPVLGRITSTLRSSGRFFWPVGFIIVISAITILYRNLQRRHFVAVLSLAIVLQVVDLQPLFRLTHGNAVAVTTRVPPDGDVTLDLIRSHDMVMVFPGALCGPEEDLNRVLQIQLLAARAGRPFDGAYINRGNRPCKDIAAEFAADPWRGVDLPRALLVLMKSSVSPSFVAYGLGPDVKCREARYAYFCGRVPLDGTLETVGSAVNPPTMPLNTSLDPNGDGRPFLAQGWTAPSSVYRWAEGERVRFLGKLPREVCGAIEFSAEIVPFAFKDYAVKTAVAEIYGGGSKTIQLDQLGQQRIHVVFPLERCIDHLDLTFNFRELKSPLDVGLNNDPRTVTWGFFNYRVDVPANP